MVSSENVQVWRRFALFITMSWFLIFLLTTLLKSIFFVCRVHIFLTWKDHMVVLLTRDSGLCGVEFLFIFFFQVWISPHEPFLLPSFRVRAASRRRSLPSCPQRSGRSNGSKVRLTTWEWTPLTISRESSTLSWNERGGGEGATWKFKSNCSQTSWSPQIFRENANAEIFISDVEMTPSTQDHSVLDMFGGGGLH